jgi:hypothetical protein
MAAAVATAVGAATTATRSIGRNNNYSGWRCDSSRQRTTTTVGGDATAAGSEQQAATTIIYYDTFLQRYNYLNFCCDAYALK